MAVTPTGAEPVALLGLVRQAFLEASARHGMNVEFSLGGGGADLVAWGDRRQLEEALHALALFACDSLHAQVASIEVFVQQVLFDPIAARGASATLGSLPPRSYTHIHVAGGERAEPDLAGPMPVAGSTTPRIARVALRYVHKLLAMVGGELSVTRPERHLTCFDLFLPKRGPSRTAAPEPVARTRPRVMYVDVHAAMCELVSEALQEAGFEAICHLDARKALADFVACPYSIDLAILHRQTPQLAGPDLLREFRVRRPTLPIMILACDVNGILRMDAERAGATLVVSKSHTIDKIVSRARQLADLS